MENQSSGLFNGFGGLIYLAILLLVITGLWKLFRKAGKPGWAAIVPVYNLIVMFEIVGKPLWQFALLLIPFVNIYVFFTLYLGLARSFGKYGFGNRVLVTMFGLITLSAWGFSANTHYLGPSESSDAADANDASVSPNFQ